MSAAAPLVNAFPAVPADSGQLYTGILTSTAPQAPYKAGPKGAPLDVNANYGAVHAGAVASAPAGASPAEAAPSAAENAENGQLVSIPAYEPRTTARQAAVAPQTAAAGSAAGPRRKKKRHGFFTRLLVCMGCARLPEDESPRSVAEDAVYEDESQARHKCHFFVTVPRSLCALSLMLFISDSIIHMQQMYS